MERYFSTGQSPQRAVAPTEKEEEEDFTSLETCFFGVHAAQQGLPPAQNQLIILVSAATTIVCCLF